MRIGVLELAADRHVVHIQQPAGHIVSIPHPRAVGIVQGCLTRLWAREIRGPTLSPFILILIPSFEHAVYITFDIWISLVCITQDCPDLRSLILMLSPKTILHEGEGIS